NYNNTAYQALEGFEENILIMAKTAQVKHLDETGFREMFRYAKPSQEEMQSTIEALFESWFWFSADRMKVNFASDRLITYTDHESKATPHIHSGAEQGCRAYDK
ncbi:MAG: hypothetical protein WCR08_10860, partial [Gammaproteobacteria bacterium]